MDFTPEQRDAAFKALPEPLQDAILSEDVNEALQQITKEYALHLDKADLVGKQAVYVLMGLVTKEAYRHLLTTIGLDKETSKKIYEDIEKRVFERVFRAFRNATQNQPHPDDNATTGTESAGDGGAVEAPKHIDPYREPID